MSRVSGRGSISPKGGFKNTRGVCYTSSVMPKKGSFLLVLFLVLAIAAAGSLYSKAESEDSCVTGQCHAAMLKGKDVHPVAQPCDTCHQAIVTPHPQKNKKTFKLTQDVPALCYMCHTPFGTKQDVHPPVKDGSCTLCHNPHDSDNQKLLTQPARELCFACHPDKVSYPYVHGPASTGDCTACHNPHESDIKPLLVKDPAELCFICHVDMEEVMKKKDVHPAVLMGCTSCHNPHGSSYKKFLSAQGKDLCFQCHPQIGETIAKAKTVHPPILTEKGCTSCHSPHASDGEKLLPKSGKDLCLECHKGFIKKNWTVLHGPIKAGTCTPCHNPHGSPYPRMLVKEFKTDFYVPYSDNEYQLCFSCHNRDLLRFPDTTFATNFRDGDRNLHYLHVHREKGRNCIACHSVHGGDQPKLIHETAPFGKWRLPLNFIKTENGGSCAPGCHKKYVYNRKTAGKEEEAQPAAGQAKPQGK
jgi:predicted CXXCH cytochrome family protein